MSSLACSQSVFLPPGGAYHTYDQSKRSVVLQPLIHNRNRNAPDKIIKILHEEAWSQNSTNSSAFLPFPLAL